MVDGAIGGMDPTSLFKDNLGALWVSIHSSSWKEAGGRPGRLSVMVPALWSNGHFDINIKDN
jgi:hypothetical protein